jgi:hypothetical protein
MKFIIPGDQPNKKAERSKPLKVAQTLNPHEHPIDELEIYEPNGNSESRGKQNFHSELPLLTNDH